MAGIGGITYGESQYASSGARLTGNKLFREILYFQDRRSWLTSFIYSEAITIAESFATHLAEIWIRLIDYIEVNHVRTGINISKTISEIVTLQETFTSIIIKMFKQTLAIVENFFSKRRLWFVEYINVVFSGIISLHKEFKDYLTSWQNGGERISGFFHRDNLAVLDKKFGISVVKVFKEIINVTGSVIRRLNGVLMGWTKRGRPDTSWTKRDNIDTDWTKKGRTDV